MKSVIGISLFSFFAIVASDDVYKLETKYIDVPIDHFSYTSDATFKLRYLINDTHHDKGGPIFFYTGNEGNINSFAQNTGFIFDIAEPFDALIVFAEHRFYGESMPFGNQSYVSPKNLGYLTSQQALADFVYVIDHLQNEYKSRWNGKKLPVIAFGGSYGGMLSAYIRMKYPASVLGAIASSAPIWQFNGLTPCEDFYRITTGVYASYSPKCANTIKNSWKAIRSFTQTPDNKKNLTSLWKLCNTPSTSDDIDKLVGWYSEILVNMAMVNYPYPTNFLTNLPAYPILQFCSTLDSYTWSDDYSLLKSIGDSLQIYTNYTKSAKCNDINETSSNVGESGWDFQACTEMVMPMCSVDSDMFENAAWDFNKYTNDCSKNFNVRPRSQNEPILEYGGKDISTASNIVFSNGLLDPWSSGGVLRRINDNIKIVVLPDGAHHYDLRGKNDEDTSSVKMVRSFHAKEIKRWLKKYYENYAQVHVI
ncbi:unnamed protein product [Phyllotreta striolata]|uniref:Lysosomal Pro-X carboxypeptidase n=1 Tax=Phyllotreta striolata TaxID=444603 RepID=A0A9N9XK53_PHYSR|nr:unnamed protein product [Phyllotreta striolata]